MVAIAKGIGLSLVVALSSACTPARQAQMIPNVQYVADGNSKQRLDLYVPATKGFPTVVFVHGGAWVMGDRSDSLNRNLAKALQARGIGCALVSYRLVPEFKPADQLRDVTAAFAWVKRSVDQNGGDAGKVFLAGHSAGGHLSALVATDPVHLKAQGLDRSAVAGVVTIGAPLALTLPNLSLESGPEWLQSAVKGLNGAAGALAGYDPLRTLDKDSPRTLVIIGSDDYLPIKLQARAYEAAAMVKGARVEVETLAERTHVTALSRMGQTADPGFERLVRFILGS